MLAGRSTLAGDIFEDLNAVSASRRSLYSFLSRIFERELSEEIVKELQGKEVIAQLSPLKGLGNKGLNDGLIRLDSYLKRSRTAGHEKVKSDLSNQYARLFLGKSARAPHPSESSYAKGGSHAKQKRREEVMEIYRSVGLDKAKEFGEPDDHVAVELQFMSYLANETVAAAKSCDRGKALELLRLQHRFLNDHLGLWIGLLSDDVTKQAPSSFYRGATLLAAGFVEEDIKVVEDFIEDLEPPQKKG